MTRPILLTLALCIGYALLRYVGLGDTAAASIPTYVVNKAVALASVVFLLSAGLAHRRGDHDALRAWGTIATHAAAAHVLLSVAAYSAAYYPAFFADGRMSARGEWVVLTGTVAAWTFWLIRRNRSERVTRRWLQLLSAAVVGGHLFAVGSGGWLAPSGWPGTLPPISLISFVLSFLALAAFASRGPEEVSAEPSEHRTG